MKVQKTLPKKKYRKHNNKNTETMTKKSRIYYIVHTTLGPCVAVDAVLPVVWMSFTSSVGIDPCRR